MSYPMIQAQKQGVSFADFKDGGYRNAYRLSHETADGQSVPFGHMCQFGGGKKKAGVLFALDDDETEYGTYDAFAAASYAKFPERLTATQREASQ